MHRQMHQDGVGVGLQHASNRGFAPMRRTIVHHPEHPRRLAVFGPFHHLLDQAPERYDPRPGLATPHDQALLDVPGRQILQGTAPFVLGLDASGTPRTRAEALMTADAGPDTRLLVGAEEAVFRVEAFGSPQPRIQVEHASRFGGELRIAREDPVLVPPGLDGIAVEDPPDRAATDRPTQGGLSTPGQIGQRLSAQGELGLGDRLAGQGLDDRLIEGGKTWACAHARAGLPRSNRPATNACASRVPSRGAIGRSVRPRRWTAWGPRGATGPEWRVAAVGTGPCVDGRSCGPVPGSPERNRGERWVGDRT